MVTTKRSRSEIDEFLKKRGAGVFSLANETGTYAVVESFGDTDEYLYFQFVYDESSWKMAWVEPTDTVTFTV